MQGVLTEQASQGNKGGRKKKQKKRKEENQSLLADQLKVHKKRKKKKKIKKRELFYQKALQLIPSKPALPKFNLKVPLQLIKPKAQTSPSIHNSLTNNQPRQELHQFVEQRPKLLSNKMNIKSLPKLMSRPKLDLSLQRKNQQITFQGIHLRNQLRYERKSVLNQGSDCCVFEARDLKQSKLVVVKLYYKYRLFDEQRKKFVKRQLALLNKLKHRNIVSLITHFQTSFGIHLVFQHFPSDLAQFLRDRNLDRTTKTHILLQIIQGLDYIHSLNIIHRDIKLQNIIINQNNQVKLADFGYSSYDCDTHETFLGTMPYFAPQILSRKGYRGKPADVWAFGVLAYYIYNGVFPFESRSSKQLYNQQILKMREGGLAVTQQMCSRCLRLDPKQRASSRELLVMLRRSYEDSKS